uniref:CCHC-type domain-containing protein n=1 Tax=Callithrix jacchus TaxID=9483 RepID=A0A8I3WYG9_CALJA
MGNTESKIPKNTPLGCLLLNFDRLGYSQTLKRKKLVFLSQVAWPQYQLDNKSHWPPTGTFDFNVLRDLDSFCRRTGKDKEVPYVQAFWDLRSHPDLCSSCSTHQVLLARTPPPQTPTSSTKPPPYTLQEEMPDYLSSPFVSTPEVLNPPNPLPSMPSPTEPTSPSPSTPSAPPNILPSSSPIAAHTRAKTPTLPPVVAPLREVAGAEGLVRVHVPFSLQDLAQIERRLGSFSADPSTYIKEFQYLTQAYSLTWQDIRIICTSTLSAEEYERVLAAARHQADRDHAINPNQVPVGTAVIPTTDPQWVYQDGAGSDIPARDRMLQYLLRGLETVSNKVVNYDKLREITQKPDENPALFLNRLQEALVRYTRLDPASQNGATILASHFISQSAPDIRKKLKKAEDGPETPIQDLVKMAFKVFNAREDAAEVARQTRLKQKVAMQAQALAAAQTQALVAALRPAGAKGSKSGPKPPPGACYKCGKEGHWAARCPQPRPPARPCPICRLSGHWKSECPQGSRAPVNTSRGTEPRGPSSESQALDVSTQEPGSSDHLYPVPSSQKDLYPEL